MNPAVAGISLLAVAVAHTTARPDGSAISWSLDRQRDAPKQGILVVAQGSGCLSTSENPNLARARSLLPDFAFLTVEKYGVHPHDAPKDWMGGCRAEFYAHHTVSQRAADYQRILGELASAPWWDGRLVLFGGSEGGAAVAELAPRVKPAAVVIFSTAPGRSFRQDFKLSVPPEVAAMADAEFAKIAAEPLSPKLWGGNSYRWYADIMDHDLTADALAVHAPILLVQGARDRSADVWLRVYVERNDENLPPAASALLEHALVRGEFERGEARRITGLPERTARRVLNDVVQEGLLASESPKGPVSLRFPTSTLETLFPRLYPVA